MIRNQLMHFKFKIVTYLFLFYCGAVFAVTDAKNNSQPFSCTPSKLKEQHKNILLGSETEAQLPKLYVLKNTGKKSIWIDHEIDHPSASAGYSTYLRSGQWSAFWLTKNDFSLSCAIIQPGKLNYINCSQTLSVCVPQKNSWTPKRKGSYWVVEDKSWDDFIKTMRLHNGQSIPNKGAGK